MADTAPETQTTDIAALPPADRALIILNSTETEKHLRSMVEKSAEITAVLDAAGRELAHRTGMDLKKARTAIEKTGKTARDDATAFCKAVISEEKRLIAITEPEEKRVLALRDAYDAEEEARKEAQRQAEERRVAEIKEKIDGIRALPLALADAKSDEIAAERAALAEFTPPEDVFGEFTEECKTALAEAGRALDDLHARVMAREAAEHLLATERARIEQERAALQAERESMAAMRAELEALRAGTPVVAQSGADAETPAPKADQWTTEEIAEHTASTAEPLEFNTIGVNVDVDGEPAEVVAVITEGVVMLAQAPEAGADVAVTAPMSVTPFEIRQAALGTADQFNALAAKVEVCGQFGFANELRSIASSLTNGAFDAALASADREALIAADNLLIDATISVIDALQAQQAAA